MQIVFPLSGPFHDIHPQHVFNDLVCSFCLSICFRVVASAEVYLGFQPCEQWFPNVWCKLDIPVRNYHLGHPMKSKYFLQEYFCNIDSLISRFHRYKMSRLAYFIDNHNWIMLFLVKGKPMIKYKSITSHFHLGIGKGCNNLGGCWCSTFTCWHSKHLDM